MLGVDIVLLVLWGFMVGLNVADRDWGACVFDAIWMVMLAVQVIDRIRRLKEKV